MGTKEKGAMHQYQMDIDPKGPKKNKQANTPHKTIKMHEYMCAEGSPQWKTLREQYLISRLKGRGRGLKGSQGDLLTT